MSSTASKTDIAAPAGEFCSFAEEAVRKGAPELVPDEVLQRVLSAAVRTWWCARGLIALSQSAVFERLIVRSHNRTRSAGKSEGNAPPSGPNAEKGCGWASPLAIRTMESACRRQNRVHAPSSGSAR